jgi:hypothetical protein
VAAFAFDFVFGDEFPVERAGAGVEEFLEGGFVGDAELVELGEGAVAGLDAFVAGFEVERHGAGED